MPVSHEPSAKPTPQPSATPAAAKPQTAGQTSVVPKGSVAAGAEIAADDTTTTAAVGAGLVAIFAGLGTALMIRARRARDHG
ncbi:hypothetical protein [Streptomyces sp. NPDC054961]